jgi:3-oxoacyl-[acyl-carrier protein] reductase
MQSNFQGRHAVVTGGASGIGLELTQELLKAGAHVSLWDYDSQALEHLQSELRGFHERLSLQMCDVGDFASCLEAAKRINRPVHMLFNNAGITRDKSFAKMSVEDFQKVIQVNLCGVFHVTKALFEHFAVSDSAPVSIVNISSVVAFHGNFGQCNYVAAKAGVIGFTKTLARELGRKNFRVNAVAPGFTATPMTADMPAAALDSIQDRIPVGRLAKPADIVRACLFLAAPEQTYVNGAVLSVDGGLVV